jgi:hypothetical protein
VFALTAAAPLPRVTLFTALPLMWGEGDPGDVLSGRAKRSAMLNGLQVNAIDRVSAATLGRDILVVAQPRAMTPEEFVVLDSWVREGGQAVIFADPRLDWPSRHALGDPRRAPPVTLLDPLLTHWGVRLDLTSGSAGAWQRGPCAAVDAITIDCRLGKGRALLIADADLLDDRTGDRAALRNALEKLAPKRAIVRESSQIWIAGALAGFAGLLGLLTIRTIRRRT